MKQKLIVVLLLVFTSFSFAQTQDSYWSSTTKKTSSEIVANKKTIANPKLYELDIIRLSQALSNAPDRFSNPRKSNTIISFPNSDSQLEHFRILKSTNMDPELAARYPEISSYVGQGIENPASTIYFSISPLGLQSMLIKADRSTEFIEPYSSDLSDYIVYKKSDKTASLSKFECRLIADAKSDLSTNNIQARPNADDSMLRIFRLAMSCTGEYTTYFGGTKALALAAINNTLTRVNGVFEIDFGVHMNLIANTDLVIYTNASTDPYSAAAAGASGAWNQELQTTLTNNIGNANYDIGHLFGASGGGGNAGCIACVCKNPTGSVPLGKGSGFTSPADGIPSGDNFDIDYVAHEMGHQFGGNHTFSMNNEGTGVNVEPGSGSTIMGYAGITSQDVQPHSDAIFHAISIQQITNYIKTTTCQTNTPTGNAVPTANAGLDYTIPKSTPFMLTGSGTDANGDALTYIWEQMDNAASNATGANSAATATRTTGPTFRSFSTSTSPVRYFPKMSSVLAGATTTAGTEINVEALSSVARTLNFRFTVRDNRAGGPANNSDDTVITVNGTAGPFSVTAPNTAVSYPGNTAQTITWAVAGTTANGVNCANVDILLSTDGGLTFPITLATATPNDGTQSVTIPNIVGTTNRIMIKGTNHIFFDVSNTNFTITNGVADTTPPTPPTLAASGTTSVSTNLSWSGATDNIGVTDYDVYQDAVFLTNTTATTFSVTGLAPSTTYTFTVKAKDFAGNASASSNSVIVTTLAPDLTPPTAPILSASGTTSSSTDLSWTTATDNVGVTGYDVYQGATLITSTTATSYTVTGLNQSTNYSFTVKAKDAAGNFSDASNIVTITTLISYCTSQGNIVTDELIGNVQLGTINNTSTGGTGYTDFTNLSTQITQGSNQTITIIPTWTSTVYSEGYAVFIDYNHDGDFLDSGETVFTTGPTTNASITGNFIVPANATLGDTRMRVSLKYNGIPTACETFQYGQVEDYTVTITSSSAIVNLTLFVEGYFDDTVSGGNAMRSVHLNQTGTGSFYPVEDVTVELHDPTTYVLVGSAVGTLNIDGTLQVSFNAPFGNYYLAVKGSNFITTWSANPQTIGNVPLNYDFSNASSKAYGDNMKEVRSGVWAFFSGDINQDEFVDPTDYSMWEADSNAFSFGVFATDLNGDGFVDPTDYSIWEANSNNFIYSSHP